VAAALGRLGVPTAFVSALGRDKMGDEMVELLKGACVRGCIR
jgi:pentatricopeptide repeat protein